MTATLQGTREPQPVLAVDTSSLETNRSQPRTTAPYLQEYLWHGIRSKQLQWQHMQSVSMYARLIVIRTYLLSLCPYVRITMAIMNLQ